jgi:predicted nucleic acid-binding protein
MTTYFLDSSAVVRLYALEPGERLVRNLVRSAAAFPANSEVVVCDLAYPETVAALHRIARGNDAARRGLSAAALRLILPQVRQDLTPGSELLVMPASDFMARAAQLAERRVVQGADAVHIAAALEVRNFVQPGDRFVFVSDDIAQCRAAEGEGLEVLRPAA